MLWTKLVNFISTRTGLEQERIEKILNAGAPWPEDQQVSQIRQAAIETGKDYRTTLISLLPLIRFRDPTREGERMAALDKKISDLAKSLKEPEEHVRNVYVGKIEFMNQFVNTFRKLVQDQLDD